MINDIITRLKKSNIGIKIASRAMNEDFVKQNENYDIYYIIIVCLMFADDLALISSSLKEIQQLVNVVASWVLEKGLSFNPINVN